MNSFSRPRTLWPPIVSTLPLVLSLICLSGCQKAMTPTELRAIQAAETDRTAYALPPEKLEKAIALGTIHSTVYFVDAFWGIAVLFFLLQFGVIAKMRDHAERFTRNRVLQGFLFSFEFLVVNGLLNFPISVYLQHVARQYGTSVQTWPSFFGDEFKKFLLSYFVITLGMLLLFKLIRKFPKRWWLAFWFPSVAFILFAMYVQPYWIEPMFNRFEPLALHNAPLVDQLEKVVHRGEGIEIPPERMFLMQASEKVTTLNAYVSGFGSSKRVVVWDTSIAKGTADDISFIFGHEMGHYVLQHILNDLLFSFFLMFIAFFLGFRLFQKLLIRYGARWRIHSQNDWASFAVFIMVMEGFIFIMEPIGNTYSRAAEHAADVYGQEAIHGIAANPEASAVSTFQILGENSFASPYPSAFVEFWTYSHPPIGKRAAFAKHYHPWDAGEAPKYFSAP